MLTVVVRLLAAVGLTLGVLAASAGVAGAAPCGPTYVSDCTPTVTVSTTSPVPGVPFTITVYAGPGIGVVAYVQSTPVEIGAGTADSNGVASFPATIPAGYTGQHTVVVQSATGAILSTFTVSLATGGTGGTGGSGSSGSTSGSGSGSLASTGVAVTGIAVTGVALIVAGGVLLMRGRRRRLPAGSA